jgi:hypothetical protein
MTNAEFESEFDVLFEDLATAGSKGLDIYEKSLCLTYAQEQMVKMFANGGMTMELSNIIKFQSDAPGTPGNYPNSTLFPYLDSMKILDRYLTNGTPEEQVYMNEVQPIVIESMYKAAYKYPAKNLAYVVVGDSFDEVFPPLNYSTVSYVRRYVEYPTPVILDALTGGDTINGLTAATPPILHEEQHRTLLEAAVNFAVKTYIGVEEKQVPQPKKG